jgi:hypothetical protein
MGHRGELYRVEMPGEQTTMRRVWMVGHTFQRGAAHMRRTGCWLRPEPGARRRPGWTGDGTRPDQTITVDHDQTQRSSLVGAGRDGALF